jgi:dTDP-4-amino-4,6-dideoxygalactose transaminase
VVVEYSPLPGGPSRDQLIEALWAENVIARKYFWPGCHHMEPYRTLYPDAAARLPHTEAVAAKLVVLPTGTGVSPDDIERLCDLLGLMVSPESRLADRMGALPRVG